MRTERLRGGGGRGDDEDRAVERGKVVSCDECGGGGECR